MSYTQYLLNDEHFIRNIQNNGNKNVYHKRIHTCCLSKCRDTTRQQLKPHLALRRVTARKGLQTMWLHLHWRGSHTSETWFCLQEGVWQYLGKDRDVHLDLGLCMCVYKHMCKKSSKQRLEICTLCGDTIKNLFQMPKRYNLLMTPEPPYYSRCVTLEDQQQYCSLLDMWPPLSRRHSREVRLLFSGVGKGYTFGHVTNLR